MDEAKDEERSTYNLALRVLTLNFAAIHTTSMVCTCKLYLSRFLLLLTIVTVIGTDFHPSFV